MNLDEIIDNIYLLPGDSKMRLLAGVAEVQQPKGHILLHADKVERNIYFLKKGIARAYTYAGTDEITFWFGKEGDTIISMSSYIRQEKGYEDIELLEHCTLYQLNAESLQQLYKTDIHIANWGRKFAEQELIKTEERLISRQLRSARERYQELLIRSPELVQRIPLGYIASYLGITQVSLSRIRSAIR